MKKKILEKGMFSEDYKNEYFCQYFIEARDQSQTK